jgi:beta-xylosidase
VTTESQPLAEAWRDPALLASERVADLMSRMTRRDKVAQLAGVWMGVDAASGEMTPHQHELTATAGPWEELIQDGIGQLTRVYGTAPVEPATGARQLARSQRQIMAASRFGIPATVHEECLTGLLAWQATVFPGPLSWGASFDPDLVERMAATIGHTMRALGIHQGMAPVLDVVRDLRWGRVEETIGEDPYLVGSIGSAYVRGLESVGVISTLKHFAGHSGSKAGRNQAPVSIGRRELADVMLPPFEMALRAGARSVMNAYTDLDGVPSAADPTLLSDLLRDTYGFDGTVVSDYFSVSFLQTQHGVAATPTAAAALSLAAGIDVELPMVDCYGQPLLAGLESGQIDEALVDRAVERVLRQKCELGLFDPDWSPDPPALGAESVDLNPVDARELARELAERSIVLLHNDGTLPLAPSRRIAVVGPRAHDPGALLGCYSFPRHVGVHHPDVPLGLDIPTVLDALRGDSADYRTTYAQGCPVVGGDDAAIAEAVDAARQADLCLAVLGDQSGMFGAGTSGEGCDATNLRLPGRQSELLDAVLDTGTPVVLVLLVGRPYELPCQLDRLAAVICGFFPGQAGGLALADVLSGRLNPSGRLPVSFPAAGATQPWTYLAPRLGGRNEASVIDPEPLFPFGAGLSYTPATWVDARAASDAWPTDGTCRVSVTLRNEATRSTTEVVQVYLHDPVAEVARPLRQLIAAPRVGLAPGQTRTVVIDLHADLTSYSGRTGGRQVDPGEVELHIGASSGDIRATLRLAMTGPRRAVGCDRVLHPTVSLE